jgi:hypothetical protein
MVGTGQHTVKDAGYGRFHLARHLRRAPDRTSFARCAFTITPSQEHMRECKSAGRANGLLADETAHGGTVALFL